MPSSPYDSWEESDWSKCTEQLIAKHPLKPKEIVEVVLKSWDAIFESRIGSHGFQIGKDLLPKPQIMGFFLHELIPLEFRARYPKQWDIDKRGGDKDLVYLPDPHFSTEIKTSTHLTSVFGNRSYAQPAAMGKKVKSGYYITINFGKFLPNGGRPSIHLIRFGWLDHTDWIAQKAATGQQARLAATANVKMKTLYRIE